MTSRRYMHVSHDTLDRQQAAEYFARATTAMLDGDTDGLAAALLFAGLGIVTIARIDTEERARTIAEDTIRRLRKDAVDG